MGRQSIEFLIKTINTHNYRIPFVSPIRVGKNILEYREGIVVELTDETGEQGYGEVAPLDGFSVETMEQACEQVITLVKQLCGKKLSVHFDIPGCFFPVVEGLPVGLYPSVRFGIETAVFHLMEKQLKKNFSTVVTENPKQIIPVNALLQGEFPEIEDSIRELTAKGFKTIKIKVGRGEVEEDIRTVERVLGCLPGGVNIRLDANRLWDIGTAVKFGKGVSGERIEYIEYIEEPCEGREDISYFYEQTGIGVALDESLREIDIEKPCILEGVRAFVLKPVVLGGVERVGRWIDLARRNRIKPVISSSYEVGYGFRMLVEMAASIDFDNTASGLDTSKYLVSNPVTIENGTINLSNHQHAAGPVLHGPGVYPMQHTSSQNPKRMHAPRTRRRHIAIISERETYTYHQFDRVISRAAAFLQAKDIKKSMRVALVGSNSIEYVALLDALWQMGAVAVPLNFRFPAEYIEKIIRKLNIHHVITEFKLPPGEQEKSAGKIELGNDATIILTSGSTAGEKAVLHTIANYYYNALGSNENIPLGPGDRWLLSLPLYHVGGLGILFRCSTAMAAVVIPSEQETLIESIIKYKVTHVSLVSTQLQRLVERLEKSGTDDLSHLKAVLLGGSGFPPGLIEKALSFHLPIFTTYGLSETASQLTTTPPDAPADKLFTSGKLLNYRELKIDESSEICVKGRTLFKGYIEGESISLPVDTDGWFHTGDLGFLDEEGYLHVTGRKDNMFISGGENIMPEEIETVLTQFPEIQQAVVVPVNDETYGLRPVAFLKIVKNSSIEKESLFAYLQKKLPRFKIPDIFYLWPPEMDETSLKVKRPLFRELLQSPDKLKLLFRK